MDEDGEEDVGALILRAAIELVEAEKGLLIGPEPTPTRTAISTSWLAQGFEHDPRGTALWRSDSLAPCSRGTRSSAKTSLRGPGVAPSPRAADAEIDGAGRDSGVPARPLPRRDRVREPTWRVRGCRRRPAAGARRSRRRGAALRTTPAWGRRSASVGRARAHGGRRERTIPVLHRETCELAMHAGLVAERPRGWSGRDATCLSAPRCCAESGTLALPDRPRLRPGPLRLDERALIELHPRLGYNVLCAGARAPRRGATAVLYHHERFDGKGYPSGLAGTDIPLAARVLAALEAYGAMTHERPSPGRRARPRRRARSSSPPAGTQFDPGDHRPVLVEQIRRNPRVTRQDVSAAGARRAAVRPGGRWRRLRSYTASRSTA